MHNSLNILAQRISKISVRSSLQNDRPLPADEASNKPLPPLPNAIPRSRAGRPAISLPVPGSFVDPCNNEGSSRDTLPVPNHSPTRTNRKQSEMPLSCHPPFQQSWIEVQPLRTYAVKNRTHLRPNVKSNSINTPGLTRVPRVTSGRPYHGVLLPPPPSPPSLPSLNNFERRERHHSKPAVARLEILSTTNFFEQPIAPLTPRRHGATISRPAEPPYAPRVAGNPLSVESIPSHDYIPIPSTLQDCWAKRKSSHVILADNSLQLKVFSELGVELDEVLGLYTSPKRSSSGL
jgi:hypothetical protein